MDTVLGTCIKRAALKIGPCVQFALQRKSILHCQESAFERLP